MNLTPYLKDIAIKLKDIGHIDNDPANKHFYLVSSTSNLKDIVENITILGGLNMVVEDNLEGRLRQNESSHMFDVPYCSFFLLKKAKILDMESRSQVLTELDAAITKILSKMRLDYYTDYEETTNHGLRNIDWNSCSYFTFGPVLDGWFGLHFSFVLLHPVKFKYDADDWDH